MNNTATSNTPWPTVKLGDVCEIKAGATHHDIQAEDGAYPVFGSGGYICQATKFRCPANTVTVGRKGTLDKPLLIEEPFWNIDTCFGVIPGEKIAPRYLWHFCQNFDFYHLVPSLGRPSTNSDAIKSIFIPLPPLEVQREIVAKVEKGLEEADALATHFKRLAALADETFKAELDETFQSLSAPTVPRVYLGELGEMKRGSGIKKAEVLPEGRPCVRYGEIYTSFNYILDVPKSFVCDEIYEKSVHIKSGDLIFTLTGENREEIGKVLAYLEEEEVAAGGDLAVWSNHGCNSKYLTYLMYSSPLIHEKAMASNGQIIVHLSVKKMQQISIPLPTLEEQQAIVAKLEAVKVRCERLKAEAERGLKAAEALRKAVLAEAFEQ